MKKCTLGNYIVKGRVKHFRKNACFLYCRDVDEKIQTTVMCLW